MNAPPAAESPSPDSSPAPLFPRVLGGYLPERWRHWYLYLPLDALIATLLIGAALCTRAAFISGDPYFEPQLSDDSKAQFQHLEVVIRRGAAGERLGLTDGYSTLCGYSNEWRPIFCMFYAMALRERARADPGSRANSLEQLDLCARVVLRVPPGVDDAELDTFLAERQTGKNAIQLGYEGVVLGARRLVAQDTTYDSTQKKIAEQLVHLIEESHGPKGTERFWTSDQAAQLYAVWLSDKAHDTDHGEFFRTWEETVEARFLDANSQLCSEVETGPDRVLTPPVGSSLAWSVLLLVDVLPEFARRQYSLLCEEQQQRVFSFEATYEFEDPFTFGDTNSGPLVLGLGPAATGFALSAHKLYGERDRFARSLRVFEVLGCPDDSNGGRFYFLGNAMGDAILLYGKTVQSRR